MLDKNMQLFSHDDFTIFTDPPHLEFNDETPRPRLNDERPLWFCPIIEPGVRGRKGFEKTFQPFVDD